MSDERVTAWAVELQTIHHRLEDALRAARMATARASLVGDLLAHCYAFCGALTDHHQSEDAGLFQWLLADNPELEPVIAELKADHRVLASLIADFEATLSAHDPNDDANRAQFDSHLDELHAKMSAHFADEERRLDNALDRMATTRAEAIELVGTGRSRQRDPETGRSYTGPPKHARLSRRERVIVDEAGMLDQDTAHALLIVTAEAGATVALVGDRAQLPAVGRVGCSTWPRRFVAVPMKRPNSTGPPTPNTPR